MAPGKVFLTDITYFNTAGNKQPINHLCRMLQHEKSFINKFTHVVCLSYAKEIRAY